MTPPNDVATKNRIVVDPNNGTTRQIIAGQPIPPELVDAVEGASVVEAGYKATAGKSERTVEVPDVSSCSDEDLDAFVTDASVTTLTGLAGDDKAAAQRVLDAETRVRGEKARKGLVTSLQAVLDAE